jgi:putative ABC transport system permease protein
MSRRRDRLAVRPSKLRWRDLGGETVSAITAKPGRSALTTMGVVLAVGTLVTVLGLTATATGQISSRFDELTATTVTAKDARATDLETIANPFGPKAESQAMALNGVISAGAITAIDQADGDVRTTGSSEPVVLPIKSVTPGVWQAVGAHFKTGSGYGRFAEKSASLVVVLGVVAARQLGLTGLAPQQAVLIDDVPFTVVGILDRSDTNADLLAGALIPQSAAVKLWGQPSKADSNSFVVKTQLGAAQQVARELPLALAPQGPEALTVTPPPDPRSLRDNVNVDLAALFYAMAGICLLVGAVGIANTTLVAVFERTNELGLRRALGAKARHIASHIVAESATLGLIGGTLGAAIGVAVVISIALRKTWTPIIHPLVLIGAPLLGLATGAIAGLYPAIKAARIEPSEALRR